MVSMVRPNNSAGTLTLSSYPVLPNYLKMRVILTFCAYNERLTHCMHRQCIDNVNCDIKIKKKQWSINSDRLLHELLDSCSKSR